MSFIKFIAASSIIVLSLSGCAAATIEETPTEISEEASEETSENSSSGSRENDIDVRASACSEVISDATIDKTSSEYKGCLLETEIPNLASFLSLADGESALFHAVEDTNRNVTEIKKFTDANGNGVMDADEVLATYTVNPEVMIVEVQQDTSPEIEGNQVKELASMLFLVP